MDIIHLIDVSAAQGDIPPSVWQALRTLGVRAVIVKLTEGLWIDGRAMANIQRARDAGLLVSVYAFARMSLGDPESQVEALAKALNGRKPDFPVVLDFESAPDSWNAEKRVAWAERWVLAAKDTFGGWPILYSYPYFLTSLGVFLTRSSVLAQCLLWIAGGRQYINGDGHIPDPTRESPPVVPLWGSNWTLWQFDGNGGRRLPNGVDVDWNVFRGDEAAFRTFRGLPDDLPQERATVPELEAETPPSAPSDALSDVVHDAATEEVTQRHEDES